MRLVDDATDGLAGAILELEDRRLDAMVDADVGTLAELFAEECTYVHATGLIDSRRSYMDRLATGVYAYRDITVLDRAVTVSGRTAVVSYRFEVKVAVSGELVTMRSQGMAVWTHRDQWELVAFQATPLKGGDVP
jgi:hypothetical protein